MAIALATAAVAVAGGVQPVRADDGAGPCGSVEVATDWTPFINVGVTTVGDQTFVCYNIAGVRSDRVILSGIADLVTASPTFDCPTWTPGSIGDPGDPATYVAYRVGTQTLATATKVCIEARGTAVTLSLGSIDGVIAHDDNGWALSYGDCAERSPQAYASVEGPVGGHQAVMVYDPTNPTGDPKCDDVVLGGVIECNPVWYVRYSPAYCPPLADPSGEIGAAVAYVVGTVSGAVDAVLDEVHAVVDPIVADALQKAQDTLDLVPVKVAGDATGCTTSVATFGDVAVSRSATGQTPVSVCVANGSTVARVTIG